VKFIIVPMATQ